MDFSEEFFFDLSTFSIRVCFFFIQKKLSLIPQLKLDSLGGKNKVFS